MFGPKSQLLRRYEVQREQMCSVHVEQKMPVPCKDTRKGNLYIIMQYSVIDRIRLCQRPTIPGKATTLSYLLSRPFNSLQQAVSPPPAEDWLGVSFLVTLRILSSSSFSNLFALSLTPISRLGR